MGGDGNLPTGYANLTVNRIKYRWKSSLSQLKIETHAGLIENSDLAESWRHCFEQRIELQTSSPKSARISEGAESQLILHQINNLSEVFYSII